MARESDAPHAACKDQEKRGPLLQAGSREPHVGFSDRGKRSPLRRQKLMGPKGVCSPYYGTRGPQVRQELMDQALCAVTGGREAH